MNHLESPPNLSLSLRKFWSWKKFRIKTHIFGNYDNFRMYLLETVETHMNAAVDSENTTMKMCAAKYFRSNSTLKTGSEDGFGIFGVSYLKIRGLIGCQCNSFGLAWPSCHAALDVVSRGYPIVWEEHLFTMLCFNHFSKLSALIIDSRYPPTAWR